MQRGLQPLHQLERLDAAMQAAGAGAADSDAPVNSCGTAGVDGSDGAGERMERTVPSEQQQTSSPSSGVLGECQGDRGSRFVPEEAECLWYK